MPLLLLLFILVPVAEIALFIEIGGAIGTWSTVGVIVLTAIIGTTLVRQQGLQTLARTQRKLDEGAIPVEEALTGVCLLVAGALLLTPGFLTDAVGFALLVPPVRMALGMAVFNYLKRNGKIHMQAGGPGAGPFGGAGPGHGHARDGAAVIDGEFEEVDPEPGRPDPDSPWAGGTEAGGTGPGRPDKELPRNDDEDSPGTDRQR